MRMTLLTCILMLCSTVKGQIDSTCYDQAFQEWFRSTASPICLSSCTNFNNTIKNAATCCSNSCLGRVCAYFMANGYMSECYQQLMTDCSMAGFPIATSCEGYRVGFNQKSYQVEERAVVLNLTIVSTGGTEEVAVKLRTEDDSAVSPDDYEAVTLNITFPPGEYLKELSIPIVHDNIAEPDETFLCILSALKKPANDTLVLDPVFVSVIIGSDATTSNTIGLAVGMSASVGTFTLIATVAVIIIRQRRKKKDKQLSRNPALEDNTGMSNQQAFKLSPTKLIQSNRIRLLDSIGEGEFGIVYKAHLVKDVIGMPETVAVKTLKHYYNDEESEKIIEEGLRMVDLEHPNVLGLIGVCVDAGPAPYLIMPFMGHGNLLSFLKKRRPELDISKDSDEEKVLEVQKRLLDMCLQIAKGMEYLASQKLVHRDLAARNCMLDMNYVIKVADFGLTENVYTKAYFRQSKNENVKLPVKWMAPESLHDGIFTERTDVWSFGVTCWETFSGGRNPYPGIDPFSLSQLLAAGKRMDKPTNAACSDEIYEIMLDCWKADPEERPLFSHLVVSIESYLGKLGGYVDFGALQ